MWKVLEDLITGDPSIKGPKYKPKLEAALVSAQSVETKTWSKQRGHLDVGQWVCNLVGTSKDATVWQISSSKRWSPENGLSKYLPGDHQSSFYVVLHMTFSNEANNIMVGLL